MPSWPINTDFKKLNLKELLRVASLLWFGGRTLLEFFRLGSDWLKTVAGYIVRNGV